uniref:seipin-2-like n=1 Tax=Erigeron canadensis TaxID=72917 RepID=UPI001CB975E8|nr:seipin-2-like [Erigeron canadensis]
MEHYHHSNSDKNIIKHTDHESDKQSFTDAPDSFDPECSNNTLFPSDSTISNSENITLDHTTSSDNLSKNGNDNTSEITNVNNDTHLPVYGSNYLFSLGIKMIEFQLNLLVNSIMFPLRLPYYSYVFMIDPFSTLNVVKEYILTNISRFSSLGFDGVDRVMDMLTRNNESLSKLCVQIAWGLLWSVYVGFVLVSLLIFAFVVSGVVLKRVLEEPVMIMQELSFDYTKDSPTAFVPLMSCPESSFLECSDLIGPGEGDDYRVISPGRKVYVTVLLTLPESYYNRNLGIFQVRVDFLSVDGKRLASTRQPCMLHYRSQPIRLILTFLKLAPLISGYSSESQTLNIKFRGYTERDDPLSCLRVTLEQRAEYTKGAGVPEIYEAFLKIESQPPFLKRILWSWKGTVYIWVSLMIFLIEMLFTLVCCTPMIVPRLQPRSVSVNANASRNTRPVPK